MKTPLKTILWAGFIAGTLDILAAIFVYSILQNKVSAVKLLQSIASGVFKNKAYSGGMEMALFGLYFHFFIAISFAAIYFLIIPYFAFLKKYVILSGIGYGILIWAIMNLAVLPMVFGRMAAINLSSFLTALGIVIVAVGIPISWITNKYYSFK